MDQDLEQNLDNFEGRIETILYLAEDKGAVVLRDTKSVLRSIFHILTSRGGFPENISETGIQIQDNDIKQALTVFLSYLRENEDYIVDNEAEYIDAITQLTLDDNEVGGKRNKKVRKHTIKRKAKSTRKHLKRRKHTRKHYRPKGKKL